jgi:hypothetical protein
VHCAGSRRTQISHISKARCGAPEFPFWEKATKLTRRRQLRCPRKVPQGGLQSAGAHLRDSGRVDGRAFKEVSTAHGLGKVPSHIRGRICTGKRDSSQRRVEG